VLIGTWEAAFENDGQTLAEMSSEDIYKISSRRRALEKLHAWILENTL